MPALLGFLLVLVVSKELLYFNEELLVIVSFISFLTVISFAIGDLVGTSLDSSIQEVSEGVSSKISDYTSALEVNGDVLANQIAISLGSSSLALSSLEAVLAGSEKTPLKLDSINRLLNVTMARSFLANEQSEFQGPSAPSLILNPAVATQTALLSNTISPISTSCFVSLPDDALVLVVLNSLLVSSLR